MKKIVFSFVFLIIIIYSFFAPEIIVNAAKNGIQIWFHQVLPSLLPFTILSNILIKSNLLKEFKGNRNGISCCITLFCGFVFGFPIGAKLSADFYKQNLLSYKQANILSILTNNFSPMFVCGFAMPMLFQNTEFIKCTYCFLYLIPLSLATLFLLNENRKEKHNIEDTNYSRFYLNMKTIDYSISNGFEALIKICGYIVLFSIIASILSFLPDLCMPVISNLEITNGLYLLSKSNYPENIRYYIAIQLLSFGGFSGIAQTGSILSEAGLSVHKYIIGKALLSLLLTLFAYIYVFFIH